MITSCKKEEKRMPIINSKDYNLFMNPDSNITFNNALSEKTFWSKRLRKDSTGVGNLGPLANAYSVMYNTSGDILYLKNAEKLFRKSIKISANNKDAYVRSLAKNLMTQHRFKEAQDILEKSFLEISHKRATQLLLFDVFMELGTYKKADSLLAKLKNNNDYNYLIRLSNWNKYQGNLEVSIRSLEKAMQIANSRKSKLLQIWTYTKLADLYLYSGEIKKAYNLYLEVLKLQPDHIVSKKGIAWIAYSYEKNTAEAKRIIASITKNHKAPDTDFFLAEIAEFEGNISEANRLKNRFVEKVASNEYGSIYNSELIQTYIAINPKKALHLAQKEIEIRKTNEAYSLLGYAQLINGEKEKALQTVSKIAIIKSINITSLYYLYCVYKANNKEDNVVYLKDKLTKYQYQLGLVKTL